MNIAIIGKFERLHDEEYIARSFEMLGHTVFRIPSRWQPRDALQVIEKGVDVVIFTKLNYQDKTKMFIDMVKKMGVTTVCWLFDLYWGYPRETQITVSKAPFFTADWVITTDNGHNEKWKKYGINHACVRQGIYKDECFIAPEKEKESEVVFIGSHNTLFPYRLKLMEEMEKSYDFKWYGRFDTLEVRNSDLNEVFAKSRVVIGDSVYSPHYWSNRVVETLGRGGFLIHQDVPGLKEEYPHIVTYEKENVSDLKKKIDYYLEHEDERKEIIKKNHEWVLNNYTMDKKCNELLKICQNPSIK